MIYKSTKILDYVTYMSTNYFLSFFSNLEQANPHTNHFKFDTVRRNDIGTNTQPTERERE